MSSGRTNRVAEFNPAQALLMRERDRVADIGAKELELREREADMAAREDALLAREEELNDNLGVVGPEQSGKHPRLIAAPRAGGADWEVIGPAMIRFQGADFPAVLMRDPTGLHGTILWEEFREDFVVIGTRLGDRL